MKLILKNKLVSLGGSSFVLDENGNQKFVVKGNMFTFTRKKKIYDMEGNLLYIVRNKYWHFLKDTCFVYNADKQKVLTISENRFDFKKEFIVNSFEDEIAFTGKFFQFPNIKLDIEKNGVNIGTLTKDFTIARDQYTLNINDDNEAGLFVALVVAVDNIIDKKRED